MEPTLSRAQRWALAFAATFTMTISYVDRQTLAVLAPRVTAELHIDERGFGWLLSAFSFAYLVGAPMAGAWIDRVGARRGLMVAVLAWTAVAAAHTLAPGFATLFALRVALGFAESPSFPGAAQAIQRAMPVESRSRAMGVLFTGSSVGAMIAPPLATWLATAFSWRVAFVGTALAGLVWVPVWLACAWSPAARAALDRPAETVAPPRPDDTSAAPYRGAAPRDDLRSLLRHPAMWRAVALIVASAPAIAFVLLWSSKFLVRTYGLSLAQVGRWLWIPPLVYDLGSVAFGDLSSRRARRRGHDGSPDRALVGVAALLASATALVAMMPTPAAAVAVSCVAMAGGAGLYALVASDLFARVPQGSVSTAGGLCATAQSLAYVVANPLVGRAVQADGDYRRAALVLGLWVLPGAAVWILWRPPPVVARAA